MKFFNIWIAINVLSSFMAPDPPDTLIVLRYRTSDYGGTYSKPVTNMEEKRKYSYNGNLLYVIEYHGKTFFDSTQYTFIDKKLFAVKKYTNFKHGKDSLYKIEDVNYVYKNDKIVEVYENKEGINKVVSVDKKEYFMNYLKSDNFYSLKDTLGLLFDDFEEFNLSDVKKVHNTHRSYIEKEQINEQGFSVNYSPNILVKYGVPHDVNLKQFYLYFDKNRFLIKDKFYFDDITVVRDYHYSNKFIKFLNVSLYNKKNRQIRKDNIYFEYKYE